VPRQAIEKYGDDWMKVRPLPSSGPYELVAWRINDKVRVRKNARYWDVANTRTELIDFLPIGSPTTALNLYETGQADIVFDNNLVPVDLIDVLIKRPDFHSFPMLGTYFIRCNTTRKPFNDPRVRKALALAVDKERIVRSSPRPANGPPIRSRRRASRAIIRPRGALRSERARKLLAEAGYPGGKGFPPFQYMFDAAAGGAAKIHGKVAVELQQMWREQLGLNMELRQVEWKVYLADEERLDFDLNRSSWFGDYNDADTYLNMFMSNNGNNRTGWTNAAYDELIRSADRENDPARREQLFQHAETMLIRDECPIIPLFLYVGLSYYDDTKIKGVYNNILDYHPLNAIYKVDAGTRKGTK